MQPPAALNDMDDTALMALARADHRDAFAVLVRRHQGMLLNFFVRHGVQRCDAEDFVQLTFLRLYRYRRRYQPSAKLTTFLFMMARQVWIDELRRRQRATRLAEALTVEAEALATSSPLPDARGDPDLAGALKRLPEGLYQVVALGILQELPYAEIARALGIPLGTVKSRMHHALRALRRTLVKSERVNSEQ
jgi:RNA polymerase sigma-70 factor (ECF subfamily)